MSTEGWHQLNECGPPPVASVHIHQKEVCEQRGSQNPNPDGDIGGTRVGEEAGEKESEGHSHVAVQQIKHKLHTCTQHAARVW